MMHKQNVMPGSEWSRRRTLVSAMACLSLSMASISPQAMAGSLVLPFEGIHEPASDLLLKGKPIDADDAADAAHKGADLSKLDPVASDLWNASGTLPAIRPLTYPEDGGKVLFQSAMRSSAGIARGRVYTPGSPPQSFILSASLGTHAAIARAHLLRKLGYGVVPPRWYRKLTIRFDSIALRDQFIDQIIKQTQTGQSRWVADASKDIPKDVPEATIQDIALEPGQIETPNFHWGAIPDYRTTGNSTLPAQRAFRALIVPLTLLDIPESINQFPYTAAQIFSESAMFTHPYAENFATTTVDDARWIARRIGALKRSDIETAIRAASYPDDVSALLIEKAVARRNQLLETLTLKREFPVLPYDSHLNVGAVVNGKLTRESYEGYALRFNYGDPSSPVRREEILRYLRIETLASVIAKATEKLNEAITITSISDVAQKHQRDVLKKFIDDLEAGKAPNGSQPIATWGDWIGGFAVGANRNVVTGNYYGDESKAQLVDNLSIQAQIGYFAGVDGIKNAIPGVTGNVILQRNYIHVRPVADMKAALDTDWKSLWTPGFMKDLAANLSEKTPSESFKKMLDKLKQNEILVITDTLAGGVQGQVTIPLVNLLGLAPLSESPILSLSTASRAQAYRRTTITRTASGLQVYLQSVRSDALDSGLDFNWWINVAKYSHGSRDGQANTRAYLLDKDDGGTDRDRRLVRSMHSLLQSNATESLEEDFRPYVLNHRLDASVDRFDFLRWRWFSLEEGHLLKVRPPARAPGDPGSPFDPADFERTYFNARIQRLNGVSDADLLSKVFKKITDGYSPIPGGTGNNPADSLLGTAQWTEISTEAELTENPVDDKPVAAPVSLIERHWKGWILSRENLFALFDGIEETLKPLDLGYDLINRDEFATMKQLQMYEISTALLVYSEGLAKVREKLLSPKFSEAADFVIGFENATDFNYWCESRRAIGAQEYYGSEDMPLNYVTRENGKRITVPCLKRWMYDLLQLRKEYPRDGRSPSDPDVAAARIRWNNQLLYQLQKRIPIADLIQLVGKGNIFFQVKVQGFKTNVENADSTAQYISHSVGSYQSDRGTGALRDLAAKTGIQAHELYARYLNEGY